MARKEKKGYDACYAQSSSSPYDDDDDGGGCRTNKVCFASSTSRTHHRRLPNSSAQNSNTKHTDIHHCKTSAFSLILPILFLRPSKLTDYLSNSKVFPSAERTRQLVGEKSIRSLGSKPRPALLAICCIANDIYSSAVPTVPHFLPAAAFDQ